MVFWKVWLSEPRFIFKNFTIWLEMGCMKVFLWLGSWIPDHWALWKDFLFWVNFKQIQCSFKILNIAFWQTSKQTEMGLKSSGQDILAWRIWTLKFEPFNGFLVPCEVQHFRFLEYFSVVAYRPPHSFVSLGTFRRFEFSL